MKKQVFVRSAIALACASLLLSMSVAQAATTGTFSVPANLLNGTNFTVPNGSTSCTFTATGTWSGNGGIGYVTADGHGLNTALPGQFMYPGSAGALIANLSGQYVHIGISKTISVSAGQISFLMNDYSNSFGDNTGALDIAYSCDNLPATSSTRTLNDTGITFCGDSDSTNSSDPAVCAAADSGAYPRQDFRYGRDAQAAAGTLVKVGGGGAGFDFTKIANNGSVLPASAVLGTAPTDWACTKDNVTGLIWEVKTTSGLRSQSHTYTWYNSDPATNGGANGTESGGTCATTGRCDTEKYAADVNAGGLCNNYDWRMPKIKELEGIVDLGRYNPAIDPTYFPNTPSYGIWSGSPYAGTSNSAWYVLFNFGSSFNDRHSDSNGVRLVRGGYCHVGQNLVNGQCVTPTLLAEWRKHCCGNEVRAWKNEGYIVDGWFTLDGIGIPHLFADGSLWQELRIPLNNYYKLSNLEYEIVVRQIGFNTDLSIGFGVANPVLGDDYAMSYFWGNFEFITSTIGNKWSVKFNNTGIDCLLNEMVNPCGRTDNTMDSDMKNQAAINKDKMVNYFTIIQRDAKGIKYLKIWSGGDLILSHDFFGM